ncbi:dephospho-CoA kinase [Falsibacillus pallidus]|uniref:Dephospho-CoA kinase n=1 Tax=Falsibacillus pallidus TaxID=493781 RepID=A0A370GLU7_9BACI|nr:dephospho-CoA kinase [Falsibacillus pallidus]RDI44236.1 dephospho-CoA kinase [Falsibacillus pallidus]
MTVIIGLTGGIASGKSTVSRMLEARGFPIIDADVAAREAVKPGQKALEEIEAAFGQEVIQPDGMLDRAKLGSIVFHDDEKRKTLNGIVHPAVRSWMNGKKEEYIQNGSNTIILDIPLLFESKLTYMADKVLLVYVDEKTQLHRLMERNGLSESEASARIHSQMPLKQKVELADAVIDNNQSLDHTESQLADILGSWNLTP